MSRFVWRCDACGHPVRDGQGVIEVDYLAAMRIERAHETERLERGDAPLRQSDVRVRPDIQWSVFHEKCDPSPDADTHWINVERCRTLAQLLDWNAHLAEKPWIRYTNWHRFIQDRLAPTPVKRRLVS